jgi:hypothetical protein
MEKKILKGKGVLFVFILMSVLLVSSVSAMTARVGNGKFVISNATVGQVIERTMKVYNNNSFEVIIELVPSGNLTNYIKIQDNNITMTPKSEKDFRFSVKVPAEGRNDGGINVKFIPLNMTANGKNGIVIPTTMVIFATKGSNSNIDWTSWFGGGNKNSTTNKTTNPTIDDPVNGIGLLGTLLMITAFVFVVLLILIFIYSRRKNNGVKEGKREKLNTKKEHSK